MPRHKTLKSVVTSLAQSFTSTMNYRGNDFVMGHIVNAAWATGSTSLRVDLLNGATDSSPLLVPEVRDAVASYVSWFPDMVISSSSSLEFIAKAELVVTVDPNTRRPSYPTGLLESPFSCAVRVTDDRGKMYVREIKGWWYPDMPPQELKPKRWWKFWLSNREHR